MVNASARLYYPQEKEPVPTVKEAGWAARPILFGAENLAPIGIRSPDRTARIESIYRLQYAGYSGVLSEFELQP